MSEHLGWARRELQLAGTSEYDTEVILNIIKEFDKLGHSGMSVGFGVAQLSSLLLYRPLTPLTGEDDEWNLSTHDGDEGSTLYQNKRSSSVFKQVRKDGTLLDVIDLDAVTFVEAKDFREGRRDLTFTNSNLVRAYFNYVGNVTFPYTPPKEKVLIVVSRGNGSTLLMFPHKNKPQIIELKEIEDNDK